MVHANLPAPIAPASAWCDDCGEPNPVVFRRIAGDVHAMCAPCWGTHVAKTLLDRPRPAAVPA